jgi:hypothetical protein
MRFQPSPLSYGKINPEAITAVADLVAAGAGAGVAIGGAVAQKRQRERQAAARRRRRKRQAQEAAMAPPPAPMPPPPPARPPWLVPALIIGGLLLAGGFLYMSKDAEDDE